MERTLHFAIDTYEQKLVCHRQLLPTHKKLRAGLDPPVALKASSDDHRTTYLYFRTIYCRYIHGSLEGVGDVITSEVCHSKADVSVITETQVFRKSIDALFKKKNYTL